MTNIDEQKGYSAYFLAGMAGVASPDSLTSPGAEFLTGVLSTWVEQVTGGYATDDDALAGFADGDVPVYTHNTWTTWVDLAAYSFETDLDYADFGSDLTGIANATLEAIASGLYRALRDDLDDDSE